MKKQILSRYFTLGNAKRLGQLAVEGDVEKKPKIQKGHDKSRKKKLRAEWESKCYEQEY